MIRVLVADDHGVLRDGLCRLLESDPEIRVVAAANDGREAVAQAAATQPEVVVMDISMPIMGGIEATRTIIGNAPDTSVVMLSVHSGERTVREALAAGARGYLLKESAGAEVLSAVRAVAAGGRYLGQGLGLHEHDDARRAGDPTARLTASERRVLRLVVEGRSNAQAARELGLSQRTVETYRCRLMDKLQIADLPALVKFAVRHGITSVD
ncbi:MAG TPA: response regulator transcription factor [Burkholderiales bacterium]|nr:response regulator transcription factor [Burkholderiales bacterium]